MCISTKIEAVGNVSGDSEHRAMKTPVVRLRDGAWASVVGVPAENMLRIERLTDGDGNDVIGPRQFSTICLRAPRRREG